MKKDFSKFWSSETEGDYFSEEKEAADFLIAPVGKTRVSLFSLFLILVLTLFTVRLFWLEVVKGNYYHDLAENNRLRIERIKANRGLIYDKEGVVLVKNKPLFFLEEKRISEPEALKLIVQEEKIKIQAEREYLFPEVFSHVLGYGGKISKEEFALKKNEGYSFDDSLGKDGLEFFYEPVLKGKDGRKKIEVDSLGKETRIFAEEKTEDGQNLSLSIEVALQKKVKEVFEKYSGKRGRGAVILMDPRNGEILSLVSLPVYDNNLIKKGEVWREILIDKDAPLLNRAIAGLYPSGSIIKPIIALAALEEGLIDKQTSILSVGGFWAGNRFFSDWKQGGHGRVNLNEALAWSVNTFFYYLGGGYGDFKGLGPEKLNFYFKKVGLGEKTGIDLPNEKSGFLPTPEWKKRTKNEDWYIGDTYNLSIGQGDILVTPLQIANLTSMLANGGTFFKPGFVKKDEPEIIAEKIFKKENLELVRLGLKTVVDRGTASSLKSLGIPLAGKTGTAQVSQKEKPHAWFTGFAPFDNPEIVVTVLIENGGEGSDLALKVAREILQYYFSR